MFVSPSKAYKRIQQERLLISLRRSIALLALTFNPHPNLETNSSKVSSRKPSSVSSFTATKSSAKARNSDSHLMRGVVAAIHLLRLSMFLALGVLREDSWL